MCQFLKFLTFDYLLMTVSETLFEMSAPKIFLKKGNNSNSEVTFLSFFWHKNKYTLYPEN